MKDIRTEKLILIALIMNKYNFEINKTVNKRINNYNFQANTAITYNNEHIKICTETYIKGLFDVLFIFSNGSSKLCFEFD